MKGKTIMMLLAIMILFIFFVWIYKQYEKMEYDAVEPTHTLTEQEVQVIMNEEGIPLE